MKNISIKILSLVVLITMTLSSCLNDLEDYLGGFSGSPATAEILNRPSASTGLTLIGFVDPNLKIDVVIKVGISQSKLLAKDTKVTMALDNALITAYNTKKALTGIDAGIPVPAAALEFTSMELTIPAGQMDAEFKFKVNPLLIVNAAALNIIPLKIGSADAGVQVSGNFGSALVQILGRNKWDGIYTVTGTFVDYVQATWAAYYPKTIELITMSAYSCARYDVDEDWDLYVFNTPTGISAYGSIQPYFTFDASDNITAVTNVYPPSAPRNRKCFLYTGPDPVINKYDPVTKTLDVAFWISQDDVTPVHRGDITEHYVYTGPRPGK